MNMYVEFTSKQLCEYNKLVKIIESCETPEHHNSMLIILSGFAKLCDDRRIKLKKRGIIGLLKFQNQPFDEYYKYKNATDEQIKCLIRYSNMWLEQYEEWERQQEINSQIDVKMEKVDIIGFAKLLKKKYKSK